MSDEEPRPLLKPGAVVAAIALEGRGFHPRDHDIALGGETFDKAAQEHMYWTRAMMAREEEEEVPYR